MHRYAQINTNTGLVEGDNLLHDEGMEKEHPNLIPIDNDFDLSNKKWDFETETWVEYIPEPVPEAEPTQLDRIEAAVAKSNEEIANAAVDAYTLELIEGGVIA